MRMMNPREPREIAADVDRSAQYDVVIMGGAFSGSSSAILLKRQFKDLRILIIERTSEFNRKVGESTSEVAGCFLTRVLRVGTHLSQKHVAKHGLRMWFHKDNTDMPGRSTELGPAFQGRLPTFQLNRITLDRKLLEEAATLGCELARPATILNFDLNGTGKNSITFKTKDGQSRTITAAWLIDASGKAARIAKSRKTWRSLAAEHPTSAIWTRFTNVNHLDSEDAVRRMEGVSPRVIAPRGFATNHLMGFGWWCWIIPLDSGEVSVGLTWDTRLFTPPPAGDISSRLKAHLLKHPVGRVMFENAIPVEDDSCSYKDLAYWSEEVAGPGWTAVGDACGFMDPLYSQGLDYCAHTIYSSYTLLRDHFSGKCVKDGIAKRNAEFKRSYFDWFNALYKDKYWYLGDAELMHAAFLMDIGTYFVGPVRGVYSNEDIEFSEMPYSGPIGHGFAVFMAFYNRRLVTLARKKITAGTYGSKNTGHSFLITSSFNPDPSSMKLLFRGIRIWLQAEARLAFTPATRGPARSSADSPLPASPPLPKPGNYEHA